MNALALCFTFTVIAAFAMFVNQVIFVVRGDDGANDDDWLDNLDDGNIYLDDAVGLDDDDGVW